MSKKPIIVFEGIEGSGKSHHISVVSKYLTKKKISHIKIREPGGNPNSEKIRKLILNNKSNLKRLNIFTPFGIDRHICIYWSEERTDRIFLHIHIYIPSYY